MSDGMRQNMKNQIVNFQFLRTFLILLKMSMEGGKPKREPAMALCNPGEYYMTLMLRFYRRIENLNPNSSCNVNVFWPKKINSCYAKVHGKLMIS